MEKQDQEQKQTPAPPPQEKKGEEDRTRPRRQIDHDDPVEEASDESFPASDPPAY